CVSAGNVLYHIGSGNNSAARFHERRTNSLQLESAQFSGFTAAFQYSPDETKGDAGYNLNANLYSYGVKWESGPYYVSVQQERHNDFFGGSKNIPVASLKNDSTAGAHSRDVATRLSAEYRIGNHRLAG